MSKKAYIAKTTLLVRELEAQGKYPYVKPGEEIMLDDLPALALMENGAVIPKFKMKDYEVVFNRDTEQNELVLKEKPKAENVPTDTKDENGGLANA